MNKLLLTIFALLALANSLQADFFDDIKDEWDELTNDTEKLWQDTKDESDKTWIETKDASDEAWQDIKDAADLKD